MTGYGSPAPPAASAGARVAWMGYLAGLLGLLTFVWGFLSWFAEGSGRHKTSYGGYAAISGTGAAIGFGVAAGLVAVALVLEKKAMTLLPAALAATSMLLEIGLFIGMGNVKEDGESVASVSSRIGLILALITSIVQVVVLGYAWLVTAGRITLAAPAGASGAPAYPNAGGYAPTVGYPGPSTGPVPQQPAAYPPPPPSPQPAAYPPPPPPQPEPPPQQPYPPQPPGYGPPPPQPPAGYGPPA